MLSFNPPFFYKLCLYTTCSVSVFSSIILFMFIVMFYIPVLSMRPPSLYSPQHWCFSPMSAESVLCLWDLYCSRVSAARSSPTHTQWHSHCSPAIGYSLGEEIERDIHEVCLWRVLLHTPLCVKDSIRVYPGQACPPSHCIVVFMGPSGYSP